MIPTSNHNLGVVVPGVKGLYIFWFLHQTTTFILSTIRSLKLYIFWFLHQTTTGSWLRSHRCWLYIFWFLHQTTTYSPPTPHQVSVVYLLIPTSNHNELDSIGMQQTLYIFWFLHQTTTSPCSYLFSASCISFDSYIKPQLKNKPVLLLLVVYLLIPTSNHNRKANADASSRLYIFWFLHQTTTVSSRSVVLMGCISFDSYIKPQQCTGKPRCTSGCISFDSYIKPQPTDLNILIFSA